MSNTASVTLPTTTFPQEINASSMVIRTQRSTLRHTIDRVLTLLAWLAFVYLFAQGIWAVGTNQLEGLDVPFMSRALPSLDTLAIYALAMILQGVMLILWAVYNWSRFRGKQRRNAAISLSDESLTRSYGISQKALQSLRTRPVSIIHHAPEGYITSIQSPSPTPSQSEAAIPHSNI